MPKVKADTTTKPITVKPKSKIKIAKTVEEITPDEQDENTNIQNFLDAITPVKSKNEKLTPDLVIKRFRWYKQCCKDYHIKMGNLGAYNAIGITRQQAQQLATSDDEEMRSAIGYVNGQCAAYREVLMHSNKINGNIAIFEQKNFDGMKDVQETQVVHNISQFDQSMEALAKRYLGSVYSSNNDAKKIIDNANLNKTSIVLDAEIVQRKSEETLHSETSEKGTESAVKSELKMNERYGADFPDTKSAKSLAPSGEF